MSSSSTHAKRVRRLYKALPSLHWQLILLMIVSAVGFSPTGQTAIFSCEIGGSVVFQDIPCPVVQSGNSGEPAKYRYPLAIHASWFELPEQANDRAYCSRKACECGDIESRHQGSLPQAVADALYLDGSWHRYESSYQQWLNIPSGIDDHSYRKQLVDAACHIMMSQSLLREYAEAVLSELKQRVRKAENLGFDIVGPCEQGIADACYHYDSVQLYKQLLKDAAALSSPRVTGIN